MSFYLIGHPLGHSCSPELHGYFGNEDYSLKDIPEQSLKAFLREGTYDGLNITLPYKRAAVMYMDRLSPRAQETGAVNTVVKTREGLLLGDNTDIDGMERLIASIGVDIENQRVLILGTGGTAQTAHYVADRHGASMIWHVSRTGDINYENMYALCGSATILINTTPVGMYPDLYGCPVELERLSRLRAVVDVVYNPLRTTLTERARKLGLPHANGLRMLVEQARAAEQLFFSRTITDEEAEAVYTRLKLRHTNIVLTGMPGSGKTSVGKRLAAQSGRAFLDTDQLIVNACGMEIPEIFEKKGEAFFRDKETEVIRQAAGQQGIIIAVGGGAPLRETNKDYLRRNSRIYLLERSLSQLDRTDRPLSSSARVLEKMFETRMPHYLALADQTVSNHESLDHCAQLIWEDFNTYAYLGD